MKARHGALHPAEGETRHRLRASHLVEQAQQAVDEATAARDAAAEELRELEG